MPGFIHPEEASVERLVDHIAYVADLVGIEHVAIGSDYDGMGSTTPLVEDISMLPILTQAMMERGLSKEDIVKVWGGNFMRLLENTIDTNE